MSENAMIEIVFQGAKCFWRTRNTVDVIIVHHTTFDVFEIITYEPSFDKEAPRVYLDNAILNTKIDEDVVEEKLKAAKEPSLRRHEVPDTEKLRKEVINKEKAAYILNRLFITEFIPEKKMVKVEMQFNFRDHDDAHATGTDISLVACARPPGLQPYKSPHYHTLM